jgi:hypothetical protein
VPPKKGLTKKYRFSQEELKIVSKDKKFSQERGLAMKK